MTLEEAYTAAAELEADDRFAVVAIGRFELIADLVTAHPGAYPWGLSVVSRINADYKAVLRTRDELDEFVLIAPRPASPPIKKPKTKPAATPAPIQQPAPAKPAEAQAVFAFD